MANASQPIDHVAFQARRLPGKLAIIAKLSATIAAADVHAHLGPRLARYKRPRHITMVEDFPRTGSGKPQKMRLKAVLQGKDHEGN